MCVRVCVCECVYARMYPILSDNHESNASKLAESMFTRERMYLEHIEIYLKYVCISVTLDRAECD